MDAPLALAFSAGMVATVNPCGFALLPAYLSYFLGLDERRDDAQRAPVTRALAVSLAVTLGFLVVFAIMGFAWSSVSGLVGRRLPYFTVVVGVALVALGIAMLRGFEPVLRLPKLRTTSNGREFSSMFLYGVTYAVASLSCTIPIFIGIVATTLERTSFIAGVSTFVAYGLGMGATLAVLTVAVALAKAGVVNRFRRLLPHINRISGVLLIAAGAFVSYYAWVEIQELNQGSSSRVVSWSRNLQSSMIRWVEDIGAVRLAIACAIVIGAAVAITWVARSGATPGPGAEDERAEHERAEDERAEDVPSGSGK